MASSYLSRTPASSSNMKTWTYSTWIKRSSLSTLQNWGLSAGSTSSGIRSEMDFTTSNILRVGFACPSPWYEIQTSQVFRDTSAWYHLVVAVDTTQTTASNRTRIYLNGSEITSFSSASYLPQNTDTPINNTVRHTIGLYSADLNEYFDGYMASIYFIDGQQLTPSSFGQTDSASGIWKPLSYSGTYGTNGFYLKFANSASLGTDSSGNGNNFTVNGAIASTSKSTDTPSNIFCTMNPLNNQSTSGSGTLTKGNLNLSYSGGQFQTNATMAVNTGKWFWETKGVSNMQQGTVGARIGFLVQDNTGYTNQYFEGACIFGMWWHPSFGIYTCVGTTQTLRSSTLTYTDGDIIGIALDLTNNISYWYKNGSLNFTYDFSALITIGSYFICPSLGNGSGSANPVYQLNFGSPPYSANGYADANGYGNFSYAVPSGFYSLCTKNLATYG